jgi:hypothetical protein
MSTLRKLMLFGGLAIVTVLTPALAQQDSQKLPMQMPMQQDQEQMPLQDQRQMPMQQGQQQMPMMGPGMMMGSRTGMMGSGMPGMMDSCPMMKMKQGMMQGRMAGGGLFGSHVTPMMNLSAEDVRGYLGAQLVALSNKRLKVGDIKSADGTITADIVTVDNSLVQRLKVDPHTGAIEYQN